MSRPKTRFTTVPECVYRNVDYENTRPDMYSTFRNSNNPNRNIGPGDGSEIITTATIHRNRGRSNRSLVNHTYEEPKH